MINPPAFYVYIVECINGHFYTGYTSDLDKRIKQHNGEIYGGARYTLSHRPVKLIHFEEYETKEKATTREKEIKKMPKAEKEVVISHGDRPFDV